MKCIKIGDYILNLKDFKYFLKDEDCLGLLINAYVDFEQCLYFAFDSKEERDATFEKIYNTLIE